MNKKVRKGFNKKGFTLIELLAVIVILAIIALIATPIILGVIEDAKKGAFKDSAYGIIEAGENRFMSIQMSGQDYDKEVIDLTGNQLNFKGSKPSEGKIAIYKDGTIELEMNDGKYCIKKDKASSDVNITDYVSGECNGSSIGNADSDVVLYSECFEFNSATNTITKYKCFNKNSYDMQTISNVIIPNEIDGVAVKKIGNKAFYNMALTTVDFSGATNLEEIEANAFQYNDITTVNFDGAVNLKIIGEWAFSSNLIQSVSFDTNLALQSIGWASFYYNSLTNIVINGSSSLTINSNAFGVLGWEYNSNVELASIVNKTGKAFNWCLIVEAIDTGDGCTFITGSVKADTEDNHIINIVAN